MRALAHGTRYTLPALLCALFLLTACSDPHTDAMRERSRQTPGWFDDAKWRRDFNPPSLALTTGRMMTEGLRELGGGLDREQLPGGCAAVSCGASCRPRCMRGCIRRARRGTRPSWAERASLRRVPRQTCTRSAPWRMRRHPRRSTAVPRCAAAPPGRLPGA